MGSAQTRKLLKKLDQNFIHLVLCEHSTLERRARFETSVKLSRMKVFAELFSKSDPKKATLKLSFMKAFAWNKFIGEDNGGKHKN